MRAGKPFSHGAVVRLLLSSVALRLYGLRPEGMTPCCHQQRARRLGPYTALSHAASALEVSS